MSRIHLDPAEWDFRKPAAEIGPDELWLLVDYEYARENKRFASEFLTWKRSPIPRWKVTDGRVHWSRGEGTFFIQTLLKRGINNLPKEVREKLHRTYPGENYWEPIFESLLHFPGFPARFGNRGSRWVPPPSRRAPMYITWSGGRAFKIPFALEFEGKEYRTYIEWKLFSDDQITTFFKKWLKENRPKNVRPFERRGKSRVHYDLLKSLSARRLIESRGPLTLEKLRLAISEYEQKTRFTNQPDVIPKFTDIPALSRSAMNASKYLKKLYL